MRRRALHPAVVLSVVACVAPIGATDPPGTAAARDALAQCHRSAEAPASERARLLQDALAAADAAVAGKPDDALAHFARFCVLGEQAKLAGTSITSLGKARAMRQAVDRALELAPDFPDALFGKGALLLGLPRLLGGDAAEGERLVRRALDIDPDYVEARLTLARALADRGAREEARAEAARAARVAERKGDAADAAAARRILADLGG
jgi:tetratricopeptide (TPR) repeat protein